MNDPATKKQDSPDLAPAHQLPSGRRIVFARAGADEAVEIYSPGDDLEVRITLTADGPVVSLRGARLEMEATEEIKLACRRLEVKTEEGTKFSTDGKFEVDAERDLRLNGEKLFFNCNPDFIKQYGVE